MNALNVLLFISFLLAIVIAQPRAPRGYRLVNRVPAEGELANRPPQETRLRSFGGDGGEDCFWIKFCYSRRRCFWFQFCSSGSGGSDNGFGNGFDNGKEIGRRQ